MSVIISQGPREGLFYLFYPTIYINAEHPLAAEEIKKAPHVPAVNQTALDLINELTQSKATAEAKVMLLKKAIESL